MADGKAITFQQKRALLLEGSCPFCNLRLERVRQPDGQWAGCSCCRTLFRAHPARVGGDVVTHRAWYPAEKDRECAHAGTFELNTWL